MYGASVADRHVVFSMTASLDGFVAAPDGDIGWSAPDEELHRFHNALVRDVALEICGRRLYETMLAWDDEAFVASCGAVGREFAAIWSAVPKVVFSRTLTSVQGSYRLARGSVADEIAAASGTVSIGGAALAAVAAEQDLIDEYRLFVAPVLLGGGTPYWPRGPEPRRLRLAQTQTFATGVVYRRFQRVR